MPTILRQRYFDLSSTRVIEVQLDQYLRGAYGRYAHAKITIHDGEEAIVEITPPANHWLHSPKLLRQLEGLLHESVMVNKDGKVDLHENNGDSRH